MNIIITGASQGIGRELAIKACSDPQNQVLALSRSEEGLKSLEIEVGSPSLSTMIFDLKGGSHDDLRIFLGGWGMADVLVNNAGILHNSPFRETTVSQMDDLWETNVKGPARLIQTVLPYMTQSGAHIVNIGSMGGYQGSSKFSGLAMYSATKAALACLSECLAEELMDSEVSVNCLALGAVKTEMLAAAFPGYEPPTSSSEMADYIYWFAANGHKYQNGKVLPVSLDHTLRPEKWKNGY